MKKLTKEYFFIFAMASLFVLTGVSLFFNLGFLALGYCYIITCLPIIIFSKDFNLKITSEVSSIALAVVLLVYYYFFLDKTKISFEQLERAYISIGLLIGLNAMTNMFILFNATKITYMKTLEEIYNKIQVTKEKAKKNEL